MRVARFSPDGQRIVSAGSNRTLWLWDAERGTTVGSIHRLEGDILCMACSPDGRWSPSARATRMPRSGKSVSEGSDYRQTLLKGPVGDICFSPDGSRLLIASHDGTAEYGHGVEKPVAPEMKHGRWVFHAEFSPDGQRVVTASNDGTGRVWDADTGRPITPPSGAISHAIAVRDACFSPDGTRIATAGFNGSARVWDADTGGPSRRRSITAARWCVPGSRRTAHTC